eukprot:5547339-Prorocentrum_lima.AAC.1
MTSSLVGSEMCIRDSPPTAERAVATLAAVTREVPCGGAAHPGGDGLPVSYTHLTLPTICSV